MFTLEPTASSLALHKDGEQWEQTWDLMGGILPI